MFHRQIFNYSMKNRLIKVKRLFNYASDDLKWIFWLLLSIRLFSLNRPTWHQIHSFFYLSLTYLLIQFDIFIVIVRVRGMTFFFSISVSCLLSKHCNTSIGNSFFNLLYSIWTIFKATIAAFFPSSTLFIRVKFWHFSFVPHVDLVDFYYTFILHFHQNPLANSCRFDVVFSIHSDFGYHFISVSTLTIFGLS